MRFCTRFCPYACGYIRRRTGIVYFMKLLEQIMEELGGDTLKSFSVVPSFGGYFRSIKSIAEYTSEKIILLQKKTLIILEGEKLEVGKYFEEDIFIKGNIKVITVDKQG